MWYGEGSSCKNWKSAYISSCHLTIRHGRTQKNRVDSITHEHRPLLSYGVRQLHPHPHNSFKHGHMGHKFHWHKVLSNIPPFSGLYRPRGRRRGHQSVHRHHPASLEHDFCTIAWWYRPENGGIVLRTLCQWNLCSICLCLKLLWWWGWSCFTP